MKINEILYKIIISTFLIIMCASSICFAANGLPSLGEEYRPQPDFGTTPKSVISKILGALQVVGIILIVISIALIGFNTIIASASEKAAAQEKYVGILVAALLMTGGSVLAKLIISVAESFGT